MEKIPRSWAYALSIVVARLALLLASGARRRLEFNLKVALPDADQAEIDRLVRLNFRNHAKAYADLMRMPRARVEDLQPLLRLKGVEHLEAARAMGKGVLVISAHMGSWEVTAAIWAATIAPVSLFAEELEPQEMYDWYRTTRARLGISVLPLTRPGLRQVLKALESNEMVVTALDRDMLGTGMVVNFFGRPARIPTGPAAIALRTGAPILPVVVYRLPDDAYQAEGWAPVVAEHSGDREADQRRITEQLVRHMERIIRAHPEQWHLPHAIWEGAP
jgi:KDO2-lipid IV(A) lauroyltransferase